MGTISAKKITDALAKAKDVGVVEEPLTIGDFTIVLRNLRPDQYTAIYAENQEKEGIESLYNFQKGHISRSIVEVNGIDLRNVDFVEVEEEVKDPKTGEPVLDAQGEPKVKKVKLERHEYIRKALLDQWTKEPIQVAWRKFNDVLKLSEDKSKEGVKFVLPEMTPEEKFREAMGNAREVMDEVPGTLIDSILEEAGLMRISTADEIKRAMEKADQIARDQEARAAEAAAAEEASQQPSAPAPAPQGQAPLTGAPPTGPRVRQPTPEEIMARRSPLNRQAVEVPSPAPEPAIARPAPPQGPPQPPPQASGQEVLTAAQRSQRIARMEDVEMDVPVPPPGDPSMAQRHVTPGHLPNAPHLQTGMPPEVAVLEKKAPTFDKQAFEQNLNPPPRAGINPRFRAPR